MFMLLKLNDCFLLLPSSLPIAESLLSLAYQPCTLQVVDHIGNGSIPNALNRFVNHVEWYQKPLPWFDRMSEAIFDGHINLCCAE